MSDNEFVSEISPIAQAYHSKLTSPSKRRVTVGGKAAEPSVRELAPITKALMKRRLDSEKIFDVLPDMAYIIATAVSSLTCSKDLVTTALIYDCKADLADIPLEIRDALLTELRKFYNDEKELPQQLYKWLYDAMATTGATPIMVISESAFDQMFKLTRESFASFVGKDNNKALISNCYNNNGATWGSIEDELTFNTESFISSIAGTGSKDINFNPANLLNEDDEIEKALKQCFSEGGAIHLTDNTDICKMPMLKRKLNGESFAESALSGYFTTYESTPNEKGGIGVGTVRNAKDLNPDYDKDAPKMNVIEVPTAREAGRSKTYAMDVILPAEAVIPVCMPGSEDEPAAYLVMHDHSGNAASVKTIGSIESLIYSSNTSFTDLVNTVSRSLSLDESDVNAVIPKISEKYADITERTLIKSLENGRFGEGVTLGKNNDFFRVMAARHMAKRDTYILCVPAEQLAYFAVDKDVNGIGRSIIDKTKVLSTARMIHLFATMRGMINNSTRDILYTIELPEEELDPERAIAQIKFDAINKHNTTAPEWGDPSDIWAQTHNAGLHFKVMGNENYPSSNIDITDNTPDYKLPEKELDDLFVRHVCTAALVDPDLVLQPENIEFASQIWSKSLISTKQVIMKQQGINQTLTNYCKSYTYSSGPLLDRLVDVIKSSKGFNKEEDSAKVARWVRLFIDNLSVSLTQPDTSFTKSQMEEYTVKMDIIDKILEGIVTDEVASQVDLDATKLRSIIRTWYSISWLRNNSVETDLLNIFLDETDHTNIVKDITDRNTTIGKLVARIDKHFNSKLETAKSNYGDAAAEDGYGEAEGSDDFSVEGSEFDDEMSDDGFSEDMDSGTDGDPMELDDDFSEDSDGEDEELEADDPMELDDDTSGEEEEVEDADLEEEEVEEDEKK